jgi:formate dehydrogenase subunit delta
MSADHLVSMVNDIANFFASEGDRTVAVEGITNHIKKFWEPRMRRRIVAHLQEHGPAGLNDLAQAAVARVAELDRAA